MRFITQYKGNTSYHDFLDEADQTISKLEAFPYIGSVPKDMRLMHLNYCILVIGNYLVFYVVLDEIIGIRRILRRPRMGGP
ncbi:MAG: type II toxin-antitoxin system RelE/ParE family toxin [Dehalobacter sp.]|nr:type II toxin-antitoxin system RelE/ParE family toxin [Dehalobacter sp.]MDJ0306220.1 type II toxin-antitoxin system RelE/ParE family toxin [Dehalobacter sp.]